VSALAVFHRRCLPTIVAHHLVVLTVYPSESLPAHHLCGSDRGPLVVLLLYCTLYRSGLDALLEKYTHEVENLVQYPCVMPICTAVAWTPCLRSTSTQSRTCCAHPWRM
jgi:hypothetical protein